MSSFVQIITCNSVFQLFTRKLCLQHSGLRMLVEITCNSIRFENSFHNFVYKKMWWWLSPWFTFSGVRCPHPLLLRSNLNFVCQQKQRRFCSGEFTLFALSIALALLLFKRIAVSWTRSVTARGCFRSGLLTAYSNSHRRNEQNPALQVA